MLCPKCKSKTSVIDTRDNEKDTSKYRRRKCDHGHRFTTFEITADDLDDIQKVNDLRSDVTRQIRNLNLGLAKLSLALNHNETIIDGGLGNLGKIKRQKI